jgi:hypothetical protein
MRVVKTINVNANSMEKLLEAYLASCRLTLDSQVDMMIYCRHHLPHYKYYCVDPIRFTRYLISQLNHGAIMAV